MGSTTAKNTATTPIPVQLSEPEFTTFILPHLSMPKRGPQCKLGYHRVFNLILWVLYTGMGSVSKVEMIPLHCPSKGISVDKQANDDVVHLCGFREANGLTDQAFNARPQGQVRALDLLRVSFAWAVDSGVEMTRVGTPIIRIISCDPKGFQQSF